MSRQHTACFLCVLSFFVFLQDFGAETWNGSTTGYTCSFDASCLEHYRNQTDALTEAKRRTRGDFRREGRALNSESQRWRHVWVWAQGNPCCSLIPLYPFIGREGGGMSSDWYSVRAPSLFHMRWIQYPRCVLGKCRVSYLHNISYDWQMSQLLLLWGA